VDVLVSVQSKDVLLVEERIQSDKKSKRANKSHVWQKLLEHESLVMDMVKHFSSTNYSATKLQFGNRVQRAMGEAVFPPQSTLKSWCDKVADGQPMKQKQGGKVLILSREHQADLLETIEAIRGADLAVSWKVVRRHALALIRIRKIPLAEGSKFPSKSWCKVHILFSLCLSYFPDVSLSEWVLKAKSNKSRAKDASGRC
jgi:hypothetical protein